MIKAKAWHTTGSTTLSPPATAATGSDLEALTPSAMARVENGLRAALDL
jgi:hypothetical protein